MLTLGASFQLSVSPAYADRCDDKPEWHDEDDGDDGETGRRGRPARPQVSDTARHRTSGHCTAQHRTACRRTARDGAARRSTCPAAPAPAPPALGRTAPPAASSPVTEPRRIDLPVSIGAALPGPMPTVPNAVPQPAAPALSVAPVPSSKVASETTDAPTSSTSSPSSLEVQLARQRRRRRPRIRALAAPDTRARRDGRPALHCGVLDRRHTQETLSARFPSLRPLIHARRPRHLRTRHRAVPAEPKHQRQRSAGHACTARSGRAAHRARNPVRNTRARLGRSTGMELA